MDREALLLPLTMYSDSVFLFLCLRGPVPPARLQRQAEATVCTYVHCRCNHIKRWNEVLLSNCIRFQELLWKYSADMYDTKTWRLSVPVKICSINRSSYATRCEGKWTEVNHRTVSALFSAHRLISKLLQYRGASMPLFSSDWKTTIISDQHWNSGETVRQ